MNPLILQAVVVISAAVIVARAEPALNRMGQATPILIRLSIHLLAVGAIAEISCIVFGLEIPSWPTAITAAGIAMLLVCERRLRVLCQQPIKKEIQR